MGILPLQSWLNLINILSRSNPATQFAPKIKPRVRTESIDCTDPNIQADFGNFTIEYCLIWCDDAFIYYERVEIISPNHHMCFNKTPYVLEASHETEYQVHIQIFCNFLSI